MANSPRLGGRLGDPENVLGANQSVDKGEGVKNEEGGMDKINEITKKYMFSDESYAISDAVKEAYEAGYRKGFDVGDRLGRDEGFNKGLEATQNFLQYEDSHFFLNSEETDILIEEIEALKRDA